MNVYSGYRNAGTTTSQSTYKTEPAVLTELMEVVEKNEMRCWNDSHGTALTGRITVVKFMGESDSMIRVTTENMPQNGEAAFDEIYAILSKYLSTAEQME